MVKMTQNKDEQRLATIYLAIVSKCTNPKNKDYARYKDVGVCKEWLGENGKQQFINDMLAPYQKHKQSNKTTWLMRDDNAAQYSPSNCRWATRDEVLSKRKFTHRYTLNGKPCTMVDAAKTSGVPQDVLRKRIKNGMSMDEAVAAGKPVGKRVEVNGKLMNRKDACLAVGMKYPTFIYRLHNALKRVKKHTWPSEDAYVQDVFVQAANAVKAHNGWLAITAKTGKIPGPDNFDIVINASGRPKTMVKFRGKQCTLLEISAATGASVQTIAQRLRAGWDVERAVSTPERVHRRRRVVRKYPLGDERLTLSELMDKPHVDGLTMATLRNRLNDGWPADQALATAPSKRGRRKSK